MCLRFVLLVDKIKNPHIFIENLKRYIKEKIFRPLKLEPIRIFSELQKNFFINEIIYTLFSMGSSYFFCIVTIKLKLKSEILKKLLTLN